MLLLRKVVTLAVGDGAAVGTEVREQREGGRRWRAWLIVKNPAASRNLHLNRDWVRSLGCGYVEVGQVQVADGSLIPDPAVRLHFAVVCSSLPSIVGVCCEATQSVSRRGMVETRTETANNGLGGRLAIFNTAAVIVQTKSAR